MSLPAHRVEAPEVDVESMLRVMRAVEGAGGRVLAGPRLPAAVEAQQVRVPLVLAPVAPAPGALVLDLGSLIKIDKADVARADPRHAWILERLRLGASARQHPKQAVAEVDEGHRRAHNRPHALPPTPLGAEPGHCIPR